MQTNRIVDRGDGPKIEGTRITVYTVLEYLDKGRSREWIAALLRLSSDQVQAAIDYIQRHHDAVRAQYASIMHRIAAGNAPSTKERLQKSREDFQRRLANRRGVRESRQSSPTTM